MTQILILGAGFGGVWAAEALAKQPAQVLILDKNNYHTFLPLLYQVAAAELEPERIAQPVRSIIRQRNNVRFALQEVVGVDLAAQTVQTAVGQTLAYDYLLIALGSTNHYFGIPGAAEHSFTLKSVEEGIALRNHILRCVEQAARETDTAVRRQLLTFVIIGGGPTGVEYAGALSELLYQPLDKDFPELDLRHEAKVVLVEAADGLLRGIGGGDYALQRLQRMGVDVRLNTQVSEIQAEAVTLNKGETIIPTVSPIWTAGVQGVPLAQLDLPRVRGGRIPVRPTLQVEGHDNVFVVGDLAYLEQDGQMLPGVAQVAMQGGRHAAQNILRHLAGQPLLPFRYKDKGAMATIGRNAAVANIGGRQFTGFVAWVLWLVIHIFFLIGFRNRIGVLTNWAWNYLFYERVVRLILPSKRVE
ncbi:MAG: NAD(P)/FAD-dependent oxidoreductase [Chloroflexi bacterium]|nr:NAD(P)/FAD-dependent oxidoreductase [Chloroflexota bacterium]